MREAKPNWDLQRIPVTFPYIRLLIRGAPPAGASFRPRMARERRAKLFAPFDALEGFSDSIRDRNAELLEELEGRNAPE